MAVYLICGDSYQQINEKLTTIAFNDTQNITFDMRQNTLSEIIEEAATYSLFSDQKNIFVRSSEVFFNSIQKNDLELLKKYLASPNELTNIIFIANNNLQVAKNEAVAKIKQNHNFIKLKNYSVTEIFAKVQKKCQDIDLHLDRNSIYYIINNSTNDYDLVCNELAKIELYFINDPNRRPSLDEIKNIAFNNPEITIYKFIDDLINRNIISAIERLNNLNINNVDITYIINVIVKNFRQIYNFKVTKENNKGHVIKPANLFDWQFNKLLDATYKYDIQELLTIIINLGILDWQFKTGKIKGYLGLELLLLQI